MERGVGRVNSAADAPLNPTDAHPLQPVALSTYAVSLFFLEAVTLVLV